MALQENHPTLCEEVRLWPDAEVARGRPPVRETVEKDHGRIEIQRYALSHSIDWLEAKPDWAGLQTVGRVESTSGPLSTMITGCACSLVNPIRLPHSAIALPLFS